MVKICGDTCPVPTNLTDMQAVMESIGRGGRADTPEDGRTDTGGADEDGGLMAGPVPGLSVQ